VTVRVHLASALRGFSSGEADVELDPGDGATVQRLIRMLDERFPGIGEPLRQASSVAIDGEIIADAQYESVPDGAEVHFLDMHQGG